MKKKIGCIVLAILVLFSFSGCSSIVDYISNGIKNAIGNAIGNALTNIFPSEGKAPKLEYGDFVYCYIKDSKNHRPAVSGDYIAIIDLTEEGDKKDRIIIPETIEGKPVILLGMSGYMWAYDIGEGANYTKLYLPKTLQKIRVKAREHWAKFFFIEEPNEMFGSSKNFFTTKEIYEKYNGKEDSFKVEIANIQYVLDDEIYFIDDYRESEGSLILEPPTPKKEGFIFDGWYLEKEYINKWDFDNDLHIYDESQKVTFLYGKWIKS